MPPDPTPEYTFQVIPKQWMDGGKCCLTNSAESVATFMWGRNLSNYDLFVNGRQYDMHNANIDVKDLEAHIKYCLEMDTAFYGDK